MNRDRQGPIDDGMTHPQLARPMMRNDMLSTGVARSTGGNPAAVSGSRPDGMVNAELDDPDGFEADDNQVANSWGGGPSNPAVDRAGRPEVRGQTERGFILNEASAGVDAPNITDPGVNPGGHIGPA